MRKAQNITLDWINDNVTKKFPSKLSWNDHTTALRLNNIMYLFEYSRKIETTNEFVSSLLTAVYIHCQVLSEPRFYSEFHNHGLYQSYILYWTSCVFPEFLDAEKWKELGLERTTSEVLHAFTEEGVHIENSPGYHKSQLENIIKINQIFINYENKPVYANIDEIIYGAIEYLAYTIKPNNRFPLLGDTRYERQNIKESLSYYNFLSNYAYYQYTFSQGENGEKPLHADKVYKKSGYAIFRDKWQNVQNFQETVYLVFKAGFLSKAHKHSDDLSFVLYAFGEDWIVDAGLYTYGSNAFRNYVRSNKAHNLVLIDTLNMPRSRAYLNMSRIDTFGLSDKHAYVTGSHELYKNFKVRRKVEYYKPSEFFIYDDVEPPDDKEHDYRILFHVPKDKKIRISKGEVRINSRKSKKTLVIRPIQGYFSNIYLITGQKKPGYQGWRSATYGDIEKIHCLVFQRRTNSLRSKIELSFE